MSGGCSLVIPGRNAARTLEACLGAAVAQLGAGPLSEIIFVDDGSTDETRTLAERFPVRVVATTGRGPGAARNAGWRAAREPLVWFIDADCVAAPDALSRLAAHLEDPEVGGAGGSYDNAEEGSLLARTIHEEILARHQAMAPEVDFLGGFNVLYRRSLLEQTGGFDECRFNGPGAPGAEDADLSFRAVDAGWRLRFDPASRVGHFHPTRLASYLRAQRLHGYWAVRLYAQHRGRAGGHSYSGLADHAQPPLAFLLAISLPALALPGLRLLPAVLAAVLATTALPMALRLLARGRTREAPAFLPLAAIRALARGLGLAEGAASLLTGRVKPPRRRG